MENKLIIQFINALPHAFDYLYWNLANTTYKEEILIEMWRNFNLTPDQVIKVSKSCKLNTSLIRKIVEGKKEEVMGCYIDR